jgi:hypothetical protein
MATRGPRKPMIKSATKPPRIPSRAKQPIPRAANTFAWLPGEMLIGQPRAARKARRGGDNV